LRFLDPSITLQGISSIDHTTHAVIYINRHDTYHWYDQAIKRAASTKIIFDYSFESNLPDDVLDENVRHFTQLGIPTKDVLFVFNTSAKHYVSLEKLNVCFFDFFAADAVRRASNDTFSTLPVDQRPNHLNLLVAKLRKIPRFLTVYDLYKRNVLDNVVLSLLCDDEDMLHHKLNFNFIEEEFYQDIKKYYGPKYNNLEQLYLDKNTMGTAYLGWPNDKRLYDLSSVSLICETSERWAGWSHTFVTEKTYRTMLNRHPFVMQGCPGILEYLQSQGYKTFDSVIDESYDQSKKVDFEIVQQVNNSALDLCEKIASHASSIQEIVNHNYTRLFEIAGSEVKNLSKHISEHLNS
jgi:hypothetical protein